MCNKEGTIGNSNVCQKNATYGNCSKEPGCKHGFTGSHCELCETGYTGDKCDSCKPGFYDTYGNDMDEKVNCSECLCNIFGSLKSDNNACTTDNSCPCNTDGVCTCGMGYAGDKCDICTSQYFKSGSVCHLPYDDQKELIDFGKGTYLIFIFRPT